MDIEKIIYLVALAVYGILSTVLSIVRTLKTSKISSEVKAVLPPADDGKPPDDGQSADDGKSPDDGQPADDGKSPDDGQNFQLYSLDEVSDILFEILNRKR